MPAIKETFPLIRHVFRAVSMAESSGSAGGSACSEERIQSLVRNIFGELFAAEEHGQSSGQHNSVTSEINQRFRLPRNSVPSRDSTGRPNQPSRSQLNDTSTPTTPSLPAQAPPVALAATVPLFNAHLNYGNAPRFGPIRPRRNEARRRPRRSDTTTPRPSDRNEVFLKDVCLLPSASCEKVPRRDAKAKLQKDGYYVDAFTFDKRWDEDTLINKMLGLFPNVLSSTTR